MPRKRTKPVAEHIETQAVAPTEAPTEAPTPPPAEPPAEPTPEVTATEIKEPKKTYAPTMTLTVPLEAGPEPTQKMRLFHGQYAMGIQFDKQQDRKHQDRVSMAGFSFKRADKTWWKPFFAEGEYQELDQQQRSARRVARSLEAEKLFSDLADDIRKDNGLGPVAFRSV